MSIVTTPFCKKCPPFPPAYSHSVNIEPDIMLCQPPFSRVHVFHPALVWCDCTWLLRCQLFTLPLSSSNALAVGVQADEEDVLLMKSISLHGMYIFRLLNTFLKCSVVYMLTDSLNTAKTLKCNFFLLLLLFPPRQSIFTSPLPRAVGACYKSCSCFP